MSCRSIQVLSTGLLLLVALSLSGCGASSSTGTASTAKSGAGATEAGAESSQPTGPVKLLHVSYDPTRELWRAVNAAFAASYLKEKGVEVTIDPSHGGASAQA